MTIQTQDSRLAEADRAYAYWVQKGAPGKAVELLLPALVGPIRAARAASAFLSSRALIGHDLSPEGRAGERQVVNEARSLGNSLLNSGAFTGTVAFLVPPGRYNTTEHDVNAALDQRAAQVDYPGSKHNKATINLAALERQMQAKYGPTAAVEPNGDVTVLADPSTGRRRKVDHVDVPTATSGRTVKVVEHKAREMNLSRETRYYRDNTDDIGWPDGEAPFGLDF